MSHSLSLASLQQLIAALRDPNSGCPWDIKQTFQTLPDKTLEEAYEVVDAIERQDWPELQRELGDVLLHVVFYAQLAQEQGLFSLHDVIEGIQAKLIHRHPHVFGDAQANDEQAVLQQWETLKQAERQHKANDNRPVSILSDIPKQQPALSQAYKIQQRCAHVGFDWSDPVPVAAKVQEELTEVMAEVTATAPNPDRIKSELGDLLFACVNLTRHLGGSPEAILREGNQKFSRRFQAMEQLAQQRHESLSDYSPQQWEQRWEEVKRTGG